MAGNLDDEWGAIRDAATDYFARSDARQHAHRLQNAGEPEANALELKDWQALVELGWVGMLAPESVGGMGLNIAQAAEFMQAAGQHSARAPLLAVAALSTLCLGPLSSDSAQALLAQIVTGKCLPALAWQENPGDISSSPLSCGCEVSAAAISLQGEKCMVLPGLAAHGWIVSCRAEQDAALLWVPRGTPGVIESPLRLADGSSASHLRFERVCLPPQAMLARGDDAQTALIRAIALSQILQAAELNGGSAALLAQTLDYLRTRVQFGKPIGSNQALQHRIVDAFIHLEVAKAVLTEVLHSLPDLSVDQLQAQASRAKARSATASLQMARTAVQLHGAIGYTAECDISLYYQRSLVLSAWLGNASAHRQCLGQHLAPQTSELAAHWAKGFPRSADWDTMPEAEFRQMVRAFLQANYPPELRHLSHRARWHEMQGWYKTLSAQGWVAPAWPQAHGGMGLSPARLIAWIEELEAHGVARAPDQGIVMIGPLLIQHGTPAQQQRFLPKILSGEHVWCQGYSEPNSGSDLASLRTEAIESTDGTHFIVNGQKIWTTLAQDATCIFMLVRTDKAAKKQMGISFLLCELNTPGITIRPITTLAGEQEFCEVFFDNVQVPRENLVGKLHGGWSIAKALLGFERIFLGSPKQAQQALGQLARLARVRHLDADPVFMKNYTALRLDVADLTSTYTTFADIVRAGKPLPASVSLLKIWASETYHRIGALLVEVSDEIGALSGDQDLDGQSFNALAPLIGSTAAMIYGGSNEIQRNILARQVLDLPG